MNAAVRVQSQFETFRALVEELATTEGRLAASVVVTALTAVVVLLLVPIVLRRVTAVVEPRLPGGGIGLAVDIVTDYTPLPVSRLFLRTLQAALLVTGLLSLLIVWGLVSVVTDFLWILWTSLPFLSQGLGTLGLLLLAYIVADLYDESITEFGSETDRITDHQEEIVRRIGHLGILAFSVSGVLTVWGIDLSGLLVGAGFLGIVVGLAARETLGSIIAGFVLMFARPFTIGDWVAVGDNEGIVTKITIMDTHIRNFDGEFVVIPNDKVSNDPIVNRSREGHLRTRIEVGIDYEADPDHAQNVAMDAIDEVEMVTSSPPPQVFPKAFADSSVILDLHFWIERPTAQARWRAISAVVKRVQSAFEREGIKIPYPQRELSGREETGGFRVQGPAGEVGPRDTVGHAPED